MIVVYTRSRERIEVRNGAAITFGTLPAGPGETPAKSATVVAATGQPLATFRLVELSGWDLSAAGAD